MFISRPDYKFEVCMYSVGTEIGLIFTLVKIKLVYWNQSVPRWGCKSAVLCGETAQGLMLLFVQGFLQFLVKPPLRVIPPPFEVFLSGHCHLNHYLLINCKLKQFNFVSKAIFVVMQSFPFWLFVSIFINHNSWKPPPPHVQWHAGSLPQKSPAPFACYVNKL